MKRLEIGDCDPEDGRLFAGAAFKEALPEVSRVRLTQTLYAEYPTLRESLEKLRGAKTLQTTDTLSRIWLRAPDAKALALKLVQVGFFEQRGSRDTPQFWAPFLYRDALELVQGTEIE